jgi:uroporphyrinogen decarboxylase
MYNTYVGRKSHVVIIKLCKKVFFEGNFVEEMLWLGFCIVFLVLPQPFNGLKLFMQAHGQLSTNDAKSLKSFPLQNDLIIRAAKGEPVEKTPIWIFRQAGRHLPEYNDYKKKRGKNFLELLNDPKDVAECTMQPIRRYNVDAAILFSDILVILQAMNIEVTMPGGLGITVPNPIQNPTDYQQRVSSTINIQSQLAHVLDAITLIKQELQGKVPLIGFSAAPWTLFYYLVGGSSKQNQQIATNWLLQYPQESQMILQQLTTLVIDYISGQIERGADMIQVFEAMGEFINEIHFQQFALPSLQMIVQQIKQRYPHIPMMVFPRGACYSIEILQQSGYDVVTIDTKTSRCEARNRLLLASTSATTITPPSFPSTTPAAIQGNLDVSFLQLPSSSISSSSSLSREETLQIAKEKLRSAVKDMLEELGPQRLIANLGEGLSGKEDPELVHEFVNSVHEISQHMIQQQNKK